MNAVTHRTDLADLLAMPLSDTACALSGLIGPLLY
jgi:hypothetical protein